jgi:DNA-binding transcriptional MerR regulator
MSNNLIDIDKFITRAKKKGVDFGKGDPYNRLRYYTKIGWLPHMTRKKDKKGNVKGHYPEWALDRLLLIEDYKDKGFSNDSIEKRLETRNKVQNFMTFLRSKEARNQIFSAVTLVLLLVIISNEVGLIRLGKPKNVDIVAQNVELPNQILDSGTAFVPRDQKRVYVKNPVIRANSKVYVTFTEDFSPAVRFWVESVEEYRGFTLELDAPVFNNSEFEWWITQ